MRLPRSLRRLMRHFAFAPIDIIEWAAGARRVDRPPRRLINVAGNFAAIGAEFLRHFLELAELGPDERVLDVGCGPGRMAIPLARYLSPRGTYDGLDLDPAAIAWCRRHLSRRYPNFRFHHADIRNTHYNPRGHLDPASYAFPFPEASLDLVVLASVFTHLLPATVSHYLREIRRVLARRGRCLATFFLVSEATAVRRACWRHAFVDGPEGTLVVDPLVPETAIAHPLAWVRQAIAGAGLRVVEPIHFGAWSGTAGARSGQDLVLICRDDGDWKPGAGRR